MRHPAIALLAAALAAPTLAADAQHPTVIELFQSQGCSSCPPANANINALAQRPDILALSFAVTYWDGLGWKDSFAQPQFTQRQWDYAHGFGNAQVWTPQVVINGRANSTGTQSAPLQALIAGNDRGNGGPALTVSASAVDVAGKAERPASVWLVRYDPQAIAVPIKAGENAGKTLPHRNIVREFIKLGDWAGGPAHFVLPRATRTGLATAVMVQSGRGGPIIAAKRA